MKLFPSLWDGFTPCGADRIKRLPDASSGTYQYAGRDQSGAAYALAAVHRDILTLVQGSTNSSQQQYCFLGRSRNATIWDGK